MPLPKAFWKELPERADEDLYDMLAHSEDYVPEALEAVREELHKRNLPPERAATQVQSPARESSSTIPTATRIAGGRMVNRTTSKKGRLIGAMKFYIGIPFAMFVFIFLLSKSGQAKGMPPENALKSATYVFAFFVCFAIFTKFFMDFAFSPAGKKFERFGQRFIEPIIFFIINAVILFGLVVLVRWLQH